MTPASTTPRPARRLMTIALIVASVSLCGIGGCLCFIALLIVAACTGATDILTPGAVAITAASAAAAPLLARHLLATRPDRHDRPA